MSNQLIFLKTQIYGVAVFHAKIYQLLTKANERALKVKGVVYFMNSRVSSKKESLSGLSLKMFQDSSTAIKDKISNMSSKSWMNSGMAYRGEFSMRNTLEHPKDVVESTLLEVLEASAPPEYFLRKDQLELWLDRALEKKHPVHQSLKKAMKSQISLLSNTPALEGKQAPARKQKATGTMEKPTRSTQEEVPTLFVRRLLPSECEKLQGFPQNWTAIDTEQ